MPNSRNFMLCNGQYYSAIWLVAVAAIIKTAMAKVGFKLDKSQL